jgi:uncharacterized protein YdeI (YjbR/CyaY-like superfamily)
MGTKPTRPRAFPSAARFRAWLEKNHATATELFVRCAKVRATPGGLTYRQALDEALCMGWIDGVRHGVDATSFSVRFTPRKPTSAWSTVNIRRYLELESAGRVRPAGRRAFEARVKSRYSFESRPRELAAAFLRSFRANRRAWRFFEAQPPWYRRTCSFWVMSASQPETRVRRLAVLISRSERGEGIPPLKRPTARPAARDAGRKP